MSFPWVLVLVAYVLLAGLYLYFRCAARAGARWAYRAALMELLSGYREGQDALDVVSHAQLMLVNAGFDDFDVVEHVEDWHRTYVKGGADASPR